MELKHESRGSHPYTQRYAEDNVTSGKAEAYSNNNKRLRTSYYFVEGNVLLTD